MFVKQNKQVTKKICQSLVSVMNKNKGGNWQLVGD